MAIVVRIKRRINDEQYDKFIVKCKRRKTDSGEYEAIGTNNLLEDTNETSTILKLAATVQPEDDLNEHIHRITKTEAEEVVRKVPKPTNITAKNRKQSKIDLQNNRFKVVNCYRSIDDEKFAENSPVTILNVEKENVSSKEDAKPDEQEKENAPTMPAMETDYVYDLYLIDGNKNTEIDYDNLISIRPFDDVVYQANDDAYNDSDNTEDSNDEGNWKNDYPDTDEEFSIGEEDMRRAVEDLNFGSDSLSSDESDYAPEPAIHFMDAGSDSDEYAYFKKNGQMKSNQIYYRNSRTRRQAPTAVESDSEADDDADKEDND